jgi:hypothetical protein|tara:strand:+ start:149 stop:514 length:366 start_codon:yes stop_codon:yes gene_type:complete
LWRCLRSDKIAKSRSHVSSPRPDDHNAGIEDLREKREEINQQITDEEDEKSKVQSDLTVLSKRLTTLNDSIARKVRPEKLPSTHSRHARWSQFSVGKTRVCTTLTYAPLSFNSGRREKRLR